MVYKILNGRIAKNLSPQGRKTAGTKDGCWRVCDGFAFCIGTTVRFWCALLETLCGHRDRSCIGWIKADNKQIIAPELVSKATERIIQTRRKTTTKDGEQKYLTDKQWTTLGFQV
jgi:hypothetical protein